MQLRENPKTSEVFLWDGPTSTMYAIDGSPYGILDERIETWERLDVESRPIRCLQDWRDNPGYYSPAFYVQARLTKDGKSFTAGGSILYVKSYAGDHDYEVTLTGCFSDRNRARAGIQVEW